MRMAVCDICLIESRKLTKATTNWGFTHSGVRRLHYCESHRGTSYSSPDMQYSKVRAADFAAQHVKTC